MRMELIAPTWKVGVQEKRARRTRIFKIPPLGLLNVASVTPPGIEVSLIDENVDDVNYDTDVDLVGITTMSSSIPRAYEIADEFRRRGVAVVLGGPHVSVLPDEGLQHADAVLIGEAEGAWQELVADFCRGGKEALRKVYKNDELPDVSQMPFPQWDLLKENTYIADKVLHLTRGCPYNCSYCSVTQLFGKKVRVRPVDKVVEFIKAHKKKGLVGRLFVFLDDNIMGHRKYARELFTALIPLNIMWMSQASVNAAYSDDLLALAKKSGCKALFVGFETVSEAALAEVGKSQNKVEFYYDAVRRFHRNGIFIHGAFMFGMDEHDKDIFRSTVDFVIKSRLDSVQFSILTPLPGTQLADSLESQGRIFDRDWSNYDCGHVVFHPKQMSPAELDSGFAWAYVNCFTWSAIFRRLAGVFSGGRWKFLPFILLFNVSFKRTLRKMRPRIDNPMVSRILEPWTKQAAKLFQAKAGKDNTLNLGKSSEAST